MQPLVHQINLISNAVKELTVNDRTTLLSACGTGKTYISYKIIETIGSKTILLMFPSLALLEQTHNEYLKFNTFTNYNPIFVCSNKGIGLDDIKLEDLSINSTTNIEDIKAYMNLDIDTKIIFSTYHSSNLLVEAKAEFDFALYDEAHRVAQVQDGSFASTLLDSNIKIKKRLFVTATPKHYKLNDDTPVFSMDNLDYFGKVSSDYSFRQAIDDGVIVDYKIIVGVITNEDLFNTIGEASYNDQSAQQLKHLAKEIALMKAIKKANAKKVIGFAERINKSKQYVNGLQSIIPEYNIQHIDSTQGVINRKAIIEKFSLNELEIIMNANLLSEGVDIPAVDMVAFMEKTRSIVNVIQRLGRALRLDRKNPDKVGYIFIPIFIDMEKENLTKEDLNKSAEWENVYEIINTIKESDTNLQNIINSLIDTRGSHGGISDYVNIINYDDSLSSQLLDSVSVNILGKRRNETNKTIEALLDWLVSNDVKNLGEKVTHNGRNIGSWLKNERRRYKAGLISSDYCIDRFPEIIVNHIVNHNTMSWEDKYEEIKKIGMNNINLSTHTFSNGDKFSVWYYNQTNIKDGDYKYEERKKLLSEIGITKIKKISRHEKRYQSIKLGMEEFKKELSLPKKYIVAIETARKNDIEIDGMYEKYLSIGIDLKISRTELRENEIFEKYIVYDVDTKNHAYYEWKLKHRVLYQNGRLLKDKEIRLRKAGIDLDTKVRVKKKSQVK